MLYTQTFQSPQTLTKTNETCQGSRMFYGKAKNWFSSKIFGRKNHQSYITYDSRLKTFPGPLGWDSSRMKISAPKRSKLAISVISTIQN